MRITHYRINAVDLWAYVDAIPPKRRGRAFSEFAACLLKNTKHVSDFTDSIIAEAEKYIQQKQDAGKLSAQRRSIGVATNLERTVNEPSTIIHNTKETYREDIPYKEIIDDLNLKGGFGYKANESTKKMIHARFEEGHTKEDFFHVHSAMVKKWKNDPKMSQYLRPATLYLPSKFQGYLHTPIPTPQQEVIF